jgi:hypothetical protein
VAVAAPLGGRAALVAAAAERRRELLLQQPLDEAAHLTAHRLLQRVEPVAAEVERWRRAGGLVSLVHGVGSSSSKACGTYATSSNFHHPRDTTGMMGNGNNWLSPSVRLLPRSGRAAALTLR